MRRVSPTLIAAVLLYAATSSAADVTTPPRFWHYEGCYTDTIGLRTLRQNFFYDEEMSIEACQVFCQNGGYSLAGLEYSNECFCDTTIRPTASKADDSSCFMTCSGDQKEICGGPNRLSMYSTGSAYPMTNYGAINGYEYLGCYSDMISMRTLSSWAIIEDGPEFMTVASCTAACKAQGRLYAGVEYGQECWCDDQLSNVASHTEPTACASPCRGNYSEFCGGSNALNVYQLETVTQSSSVFNLSSTTTPSSSSSPCLEASCLSTFSTTLSSSPNTPGSFLPSMTPSSPVEASTLSTTLNRLSSFSPSSPSPSPLSASSSTSVVEGPTPGTAELITNGYFNATPPGGWTISGTPGTTDTAALTGQYLTDASGATAFGISSTPYKASVRSLCISQFTQVYAAGNWNFTLTMGRTIPASRNGISLDQLTYAVYDGSTRLFSGDVCNPWQRTCTGTGPFGSYADVHANILASTAKLGSHNMSICVVFSSSAMANFNPDSFFVSKVSILGPGRQG